MSLDDRLRTAYRRQLDDVRHRVEGMAFEPAPTPPPGPSLPVRALGLAAAVLLVVGGAVAVNRALTGSDAGGLETAPGGRGGTTTIAPGPTAASSSASTTGTSSTAAPEPTAAPSTTAPTTTDPSQGSPVSPRSQTSVTAGPTTTVAPDPGVANDVCPTGSRAQLELASTRYLSEGRGWGRKDDLVDEQDGPFYFQAWEPNHPEPVVVEIVLDRPVLATEIRVAQDPFTPVSGVVTVEAAGRVYGIKLSGTDGWRVQALPEPTRLERFTVRRDEPETNIMEVLVCVASPAAS